MKYSYRYSFYAIALNGRQRAIAFPSMMVTITCLGMADGVLPNLAAEGIQHGVPSTSTRAVAAATEKQDTLEKTAAEV